MEIEKKYLIKRMPEKLEQYDKKVIEQGYLCRKPVVRIRKSNDDYILTYKMKLKANSENCGAICNNEIEAALTEEGYYHLREKIDNNLINKTRYIIPIENGLKVELDVFEGRLKGLCYAEVEFRSEDEAAGFIPPEWFGEEVTADKRYSNGNLSGISGLEEF